MPLISPFPLPDELVLFLQDFGTFMCKVRVDRPAELDVRLHLIELERWQQCVILQPVHVHDMLSYVEVLVIVLIVEDQEENVESRHDWR